MDQSETAAEPPPAAAQQPIETSQPAIDSEATPMAGTAIAPTGSGGAPALNLNRFGAGLESDPEIGQLRLALGKLPPSLVRVERAANHFRRALEEAYTLAYGQVDMMAALAINTAARWERHAALAMRWLRDHHDRMDDADRLRYSKEIARASAERDKAVATLKLSMADRTTLLADIAVPAA